jgi:molybdenum cofactor biosynthesis enzyme MoaA
MSYIVKAKLKFKELDGIEVMSSEVGTEYLIDLSTKQKFTWINDEHKHTRVIEAVEDAERGGFIPFELLEVVVQ